MLNFSLFFALAELFTLILFLLLLHWLRRQVGCLPLYLLISLFFLFSQMAILPAMTNLLSVIQNPGTLSRGFLLIPVVLSLLLIYEDGGPVEAQRMILGHLVAVLSFLYLSQLVLGQFSTMDSSNSSAILKLLLDNDKFMKPYLFYSLYHIGLLLLAPIPYQFLRNHKAPIFLSLFLTTILYLTAGLLFLIWQNPTVKLWTMPPPVWSSWLVMLALICSFIQIYLSIAGSKPVEGGRTSFGIFSTFVIQLQTAARMRQAVEEWSDRYQIVFDSAQELIFLLDKTGCVINANHSATDTLGSLLKTEHFPITHLLHAENPPEFNWENTWKQLWPTPDSDSQSGLYVVHDKPSYAFSHMLLELPEGNRNVDFTLSPARLNDSQLAVMILRDTTEQRQEENRRKKLEEQLTHSQRLEALGVLAGGVAHDFNNLLQGIQASTDALHREALSPSAIPLLQNIQEGSQRAAELTAKLLGFARKGKYEPMPLDIARTAKKATDLFNVGHKDLTFRLLAIPEPLKVLGDDTQLQQVILNLLINAKDSLPKEASMAERKISLRIDHARPDMEQWQDHPAEATAPDRYVLIRIKDNGSGIPAEILPHIFEPFYTTKGNKGTGLGLSMAYGCIANHHGWIHIKSSTEPTNHGTEISLFLPLI